MEETVLRSRRESAERGGQEGGGRRGCLPKSRRGSRPARSRKDTEGFAPLADLPPANPEESGLRFKYVVDPLMRVVDEGKGVRKIARYNEQKLVR